MRPLTLAAWLGGAALLAGPLSNPGERKFEYTEFAASGRERLILFSRDFAANFEKYKDKGWHEFRGPVGIDRWAFDHRERFDNPGPSAAPEPGLECALGLLLVGFGTISRRRKRKQRADSR